MADYLPEMIEAPRPSTPPPQELHSVPENIEQAVLEDQFLSSEEEEEEYVEIEQRQKLEMDDIFSTPKVKPIKLSKEALRDEKLKIRVALKEQQKIQRQEERDKIKQDKILEKERMKAEKKAKRPKKVLSPEHLQKLQDARKKGIETRRKNKELKNETSSLAQRPSGVASPGQPASSSAQPRPATSQGHMFTKEDLINSQYEAIQKYEVVRKDRKAKKKVKEDEDQKLMDSQRTIRRAIGQPTTNDVWDSALQGMWN